MSRSDAQRLEDIRAAISRCIAYREHLDSATLGSMAYDAVLRNLAVVGEAAKSRPDEFKVKHADTPWNSIAGLRNVVVHEQLPGEPGSDPRHRRQPAVAPFGRHRLS